MKPRRPATSFADQKRAVQSVLAGLETQFGDLREAKGRRELGRQEIAPKRTRAKQVVTAASESQILKAIMQLLRHHPKVARVWRNNSGTFQVDNRWIRANTARGMSDIAGQLRSGVALYIEVKAAKGIVQLHQQQFLDDMTKAGALAFVARDSETVLEKLKSA